MIRTDLAERLKRFRENAGLTIYEVGEKIGKSGKTVSAWECGRGQPDNDMLIRLCRIYGIRISDFYGEEEETAFILSAEEQELLSYFRKLNAPGQQAVLSTIRGLSDNDIFKKGDNSASSSLDAQ